MVNANACVLRGLDGHAQFAFAGIEAPCADRSVDHIAHGETRGNLHRQRGHPALRGADRHQVAAVDHARSGKKQVGDLGEKLRFLGAHIALFRPGLDLTGSTGPAPSRHRFGPP